MGIYSNIGTQFIILFLHRLMYIMVGYRVHMPKVKLSSIFPSITPTCGKCINSDATLIHPWVDVFKTIKYSRARPRPTSSRYPWEKWSQSDIYRVVHDYLYLTPDQMCSSAQVEGCCPVHSHQWLQGYKVLVWIVNAAFLNQGLAEEEKT